MSSELPFSIAAVAQNLNLMNREEIQKLCTGLLNLIGANFHAFKAVVIKAIPEAREQLKAGNCRFPEELQFTVDMLESGSVGQVVAVLDGYRGDEKTDANAATAVGYVWALAVPGVIEYVKQLCDLSLKVGAPFKSGDTATGWHCGIEAVRRLHRETCLQAARTADHGAREEKIKQDIGSSDGGSPNG
jgi:hypothetical protein